MKELEILLIEDSPSDTDLTLRALKRFNLANTINCFKDGEAALEYLRKRGEAEGALKSIVILLDMHLPLMNGVEFLQEIRQLDYSKDIPVAILTSTSEIPDIRESLRLGVRYISKPLEFVDMVRFATETGSKTLLLSAAD